MNKKNKIFFIVTGLVPVFGILSWPPDTMLLIYTVFAVALLFRERLTGAIAKIQLSARWKFLFLMIVSGLLAEILAWTSSYLAREAQPALLHPQLIPDLILGMGFYGGWAVAWLVAHRFWHFTLFQVFLATGLSGIWVEQGGVVLKNFVQGFFMDSFSALYGVFYIVIVYGSIAGLAYLSVKDDLNRLDRSNSFLKYPVVWVLLFFLAQMTTGIVIILADFLKLIPETRLIWEHPFF